MKKDKLEAEPSEREILQQSNHTHSKFIQLLIDLRNYCKLSKTQASELLQIDCKILIRHETQRMDMLQHNYSKYVSIYYLYARSNSIPLPEDIEMVCHFFMQ